MKFTKYLLNLILSFALILAIGSVNVSAKFNSNVTSFDLSRYVTISSKDNKVIRKISQKNLEDLKLLNANNDYDKVEFSKRILKELGYDELEIQSFSNSDMLAFLDESAEITTEVRYVEIDTQNTMNVINKTDAINKSKIINEKKNLNVKSKFNGLAPNTLQISEEISSLDQNISNTNLVALAATTNDGYNTETKSYLKIVTSSTYIRPGTTGEKGWYLFYGTFSWLTTPSDRNKDAMSLFASNFAWSQNSSDYKSDFSYYSNMVSGSGVVREYHYDYKITQDKVLYSTGLYYKWDLPKDGTLDPVTGTLYYCDSFVFNVRGKARVSNYTLPYAFNLFTRYEHLKSYLVFQPSFGWTIGTWPGVTITGGTGITKVDIYSLNYTDYDPNRNITN